MGRERGALVKNNGDIRNSNMNLKAMSASTFTTFIPMDVVMKIGM